MKHHKEISSPLPTVPETSEIPHILQATFAAYHSATQQGYNLSSLLATWNAGERTTNHGLLERTDRKIVKTNASEPALPSEHLEMAAHNSTDVNSHLPAHGGEDFCADGITMTSQGFTRHVQQQPSAFLDQHVFIPDSVSPRINSSAPGTRITDPSAAYLRRQLTHTVEEGEGVCVGTDLSHPPPPPLALSIPPSTDQQIAPPASPTTSGKATKAEHLLGTHRDFDGLAVSPRTVDSVRSLSGTTIASVQLSPDTEISGTAIPRITDSSTMGHSVPFDGIIQGTQNNLQPSHPIVSDQM